MINNQNLQKSGSSKTPVSFGREQVDQSQQQKPSQPQQNQQSSQNNKQSLTLKDDGNTQIKNINSNPAASAALNRQLGQLTVKQGENSGQKQQEMEKHQSQNPNIPADSKVVMKINNQEGAAYIQLGDRMISQNQYLLKFKEGCVNGKFYIETLTGAFYFTNLLNQLEAESQNLARIGQLRNSANTSNTLAIPTHSVNPSNNIYQTKMEMAIQLYDASFAKPPTQQPDYSNMISKYCHKQSKIIIYQKSAGLGRTIVREAYVADGKIKQIINDSTTGMQDSISKNFKQKTVEQIERKIETLGSKTNTTKFTWVSLKKPARIFFQDNEQKSYAVYLDTLADAVRLRDYAICFTLEKIAPMNTLGMMRFLSGVVRRGRIAEQVRKKLCLAVLVKEICKIIVIFDLF